MPPRVQVPTGLRARAAVLADYPLFVRYFAELGVSDAVQPPERWARENMPRTLLFEERGRPVAYALTELLEDTGYVRHVVVDPAARGRGIGHEVMRELVERFRTAGCSSMCLNVKPDNLPAIRVYQAAGMREAYAAAALRVAWSVLEALPAEPADFTTRRIEAADDASVEQCFGLPRGLIHARRQRADSVLLLVRSAGAGHALRGVACFDPHFPGASPFCAHGPAVARVLCEALRPHAAQAAAIQLVLENNPELIRAFKQAGADVSLEFVHYRASIPPPSAAT